MGILELPSTVLFNGSAATCEVSIPQMSTRWPLRILFLWQGASLLGCVSRDVTEARPEQDGAAVRSEAGLETRPLNLAESLPPDSDFERELSLNPSLDVIQRWAVRRNPDLKATLERWNALAEVPSQKAVPPYPTFRYGYSSMFLMHTFEGMQEIPFPAKLVSETKAALAESRAAGKDYRERENLLRMEAATAYGNLYLARRELEVAEEALALLERFAETARVRYNAGTGSESDVLRAEVDREALRSDRVGFTHAVEIAVSELNVLLDRPPEAQVGPLQAPPNPAPPAAAGDPFAGALEQRPALAAAEERIQAADHMAERAREEWVPDFTVGGAYVRDFGMHENEVEITAGVTIPLWWGAIRARIREADAAARQARQEARAARSKVLEEVKSATARVASAAERYAILEREVLPRASENVRVSEAAYLAGKIGFLELLDTQRVLLMRRIERERIVAEYTLRLAELERAVGKQASPGATQP